MRERPILFSSEMIRAILDGRKTQTRRVLDLNRGGWGVRLEGSEGRTDNAANLRQIAVGCPYGQPGDRLYVRGSFGVWHREDATPGGRPYDPEVIYRADNPEYEPSEDDRAAMITEPWRWRPSIHMPRKVSRITLELTDVRVQRVQEITDEDAYAEGTVGCARPGFEHIATRLPRAGLAFRTLWDSLNAKRGYAWASNPWVWALTFRRIESLSTPTGAPHDAR